MGTHVRSATPLLQIGVFLVAVLLVLPWIAHHGVFGLTVYLVLGAAAIAASTRYASPADSLGIESRRVLVGIGWPVFLAIGAYQSLLVVGGLKQADESASVPVAPAPPVAKAPPPPPPPAPPAPPPAPPVVRAAPPPPPPAPPPVAKAPPPPPPVAAAPSPAPPRPAAPIPARPAAVAPTPAKQGPAPETARPRPPNGNKPKHRGK